MAASIFKGARVGYIFKLGGSGLGYYADIGNERATLRSKVDFFNANLCQSSGNDNVPADGVPSNAGSPTYDADAPIVAALVSHRRGIEDAEATTTSLEEVAARDYNGRKSVAHDAQRIEVRLTDQLLQLTTMRDDCETVSGRNAVKQEMARLQTLGQRLLGLSRAAGVC